MADVGDFASITHDYYLLIFIISDRFTDHRRDNRGGTSGGWGSSRGGGRSGVGFSADPRDRSNW